VKRILIFAYKRVASAQSKLLAGTTEMWAAEWRFSDTFVSNSHN